MEKDISLTFPDAKGINKTFKIDLPIIPWQAALVIKACRERYKDEYGVPEQDFTKIFRILADYDENKNHDTKLFEDFKRQNSKLNDLGSSFLSGVGWLTRPWHINKAFCAYQFTYGVQDNLYNICFSSDKKSQFSFFLNLKLRGHIWTIHSSKAQTKLYQTEFPKELIKKQFPQIPSSMYQKVKIPDNAFDDR